MSTDTTLRIALVVGSVRDRRIAGALADWLVTELDGYEGIRLDRIDLAEVDLPLPFARPDGAGSAIAHRLAAADGFLILTPEYNHSFPAAVKNAIDWHYGEWAYKPVGFVGYGGSGGIRAIEHLRAVFPELRATTVREAVLLALPWTRLGADGRYRPADGERGALTATVTELLWWARTLRAGRAATEQAGRAGRGADDGAVGDGGSADGAA